MKRSLFLLATALPLFSGEIGFARAPSPKPAALAVLPAIPATEDAKPTPPSAGPSAKARLAKLGWKAIANDALVRLAGPEKGYIPGNYLAKGELEWRDGDLCFVDGDQVTDKMLPMILEGLWIFVRAAKTTPIESGKALAAWGLPPVIDGRKLMDPDGSATYYGQMLRLIYAEKPDALKRAGAERLSQALDLLLHAHDQAFEHQSADVAMTDFDRAKLMLFAPPRAGETPFTVKPYEDLGSKLSAFKSGLEADAADAVKAGDEDRREDSTKALAVIGTLERQRYHPKETLPDVPPPGTAAAEPGDKDEKEDDPPHAQLASGLPRLLKALDRINGTPLTPAQQENLIKSFPMGDLVWRLGVQDLWRQGLTGKGVKIAVLDGRISRHEELAEAVKSRTNLTADRGKGLADDHGTHVAGIIHALAPDAEIYGFTTSQNDNDKGNPALKQDTDATLDEAIDRAVAKGYHIINLSSGGAGTPTDEMVRRVEGYAKKGIIINVAAGNDHDKNTVESPAIASNAMAVGALDGAGRPADISAYGAAFDAQRLKHVVKTIFMLPGINIYSTVVDEDGKSGYALMDGTSMATPALSGVTALLAQDAMKTSLNAVELSARVRAALIDGSASIPLDKLPANAPFDQPFLVVQPQAALDALRRQAAPPVARGPRRAPARQDVQ